MKEIKQFKQCTSAYKHIQVPTDVLRYGTQHASTPNGLKSTSMFLERSYRQVELTCALLKV